MKYSEKSRFYVWKKISSNWPQNQNQNHCERSNIRDSSGSGDGCDSSDSSAINDIRDSSDSGDGYDCSKSSAISSDISDSSDISVSNMHYCFV